ncbi:MAG: DUF2283 domain-containing protein [Candidatus Eremiobacteraeota bacterium]|nr:DUF2283 domain-containing protein [Candidatus Eremiobacteraeota bacterium]
MVCIRYSNAEVTSSESFEGGCVMLDFDRDGGIVAMEIVGRSVRIHDTVLALAIHYDLDIAGALPF